MGNFCLCFKNKLIIDSNNTVPSVPPIELGPEEDATKKSIYLVENAGSIDANGEYYNSGYKYTEFTSDLFEIDIYTNGKCYLTKSMSSSSWMILKNININEDGYALLGETLYQIFAISDNDITKNEWFAVIGENPPPNVLLL
jgi:hypothetical protein